MALSLLAAGAGLAVAWWFYLKSTDIPDRLAERFAGLYHLIVAKYYVDEIYNRLIVRPTRVAAEKILWETVDAGAIDGIVVEGTGEATQGAGGILRRIQSGNIRSYAAWVLLGAVLWLAYILWRR